MAEADGRQAVSAEPGRIAVVGGGIAGLAAASAAAAAGCSVDVIDRGHRLGGRLAASTLRDTGTASDGHVVDIGASYLTATDPGFTALVDDWCDRGLARPWTDAFHVADAGGLIGVKAGPMRYSTPGGLRSLVEDLAARLPGQVHITHPRDVSEVRGCSDAVGWGAAAPRLRIGDAPGTTTTASDARGEWSSYDAIALCAPDPQVRRLVDADTAAELIGDEPIWEPALALVAVYDERCWPEVDGVFVNDDATLTWIADDGRRRGDGAPVLVAHSTAVVAAGHLLNPAGAAPVLLAALARVLGIDRTPAWFTVKRWTFARPATARPQTHRWLADRGLGVAGDAWCGVPRTESAWRSGTALGRAIAGVG